MAKIAQKKRLIADPTVDRETKYKYRNQISALQSRLKRRIGDMEY